MVWAWLDLLCPLLASPDLARAARAARPLHAAARGALRARRQQRPALYGAVGRLAARFSPRRRAALERTGLRSAAESCIDGKISGLEIQHVLALERLRGGGYGEWVEGETRLWRLTLYTDWRGRELTLTVHSVLHQLLSGRERVSTVFGCHYQHHSLLYVLRESGGIVLPRNIAMGAGRHSFASRGFYDRMTDGSTNAQSLHNLQDVCRVDCH